MVYSTYKVSLDIHKTTSQAFITVKRGDVARRIDAILTENGKLYTITNECRAVFVGKKADGTSLYNDCVIDGNRIIYNFTEQTVSAVGKVDCEFEIYGADNALLLSPRFCIIVEETACNGDDVYVSENEATAIQALIKDGISIIDDAKISVENANAATDAANTAADNANDSTERANTAAENANTAADRANSAADNADSNAELANALVSDIQARLERGELNGYSPQKGKDFWTPEDIAEIKGYVEEYVETEILGGEW